MAGCCPARSAGAAAQQRQMGRSLLQLVAELGWPYQLTRPSGSPGRRLGFAGLVLWTWASWSAGGLPSTAGANQGERAVRLIPTRPTAGPSAPSSARPGRSTARRPGELIGVIRAPLSRGRWIKRDGPARHTRALLKAVSDRLNGSLSGKSADPEFAVSEVCKAAWTQGPPHQPPRTRHRFEALLHEQIACRVAGPVGSGKTSSGRSALAGDCGSGLQLAVVPRHLHPGGAQFLTRAGNRGVETGRCPHIAIREDCSIKPRRSKARTAISRSGLVAVLKALRRQSGGQLSAPNW